ncbi:MAG: hypothetical protein AAF614_27765 [Chloroflexota bacterium]
MQLNQVERYLPIKIRSMIEQNFYAKVNQQAFLDTVARNEDFLADPLQHVTVYSDHGVVHVRDVASNIITVLDTINGVLIPKRSLSEIEFMKGYGVMLAYNHDIGMMDFSAFGRAMHPEFAAQAVFNPQFDEVVATVWRENWGNVAWRLMNLAEDGALLGDPKIVLRELLAMSVGHSKSKVPIEVLNDPAELRRVMQTAVSTPLKTLYHIQQIAKAKRKLVDAEAAEDIAAIAKHTTAVVDAEAAQAAYLTQDPTQRNDLVDHYYNDFAEEAFHWLILLDPDVQTMVQDVVDTLRALRVADALRQRGTTLKTSGGYQIFIDQKTAKAVIALQKGSGEVLMLESDNPLSIGEANMASSELTRNGDLRVSFHRGAYINAATMQRAALACALVIDDIQKDTIESFKRDMDETAVSLKTSDEIEILIEETDDNLAFADLIQAELKRINPTLGQRSRIVPSLKHISDSERDRYLAATALDWTLEQRKQILIRVAQSGHKVNEIDPEIAFTDVALTTLREGDVLLEVGAPPGFVYVPLGDGMVSLPAGGYQPQPVTPYIPLGNTRVVHGSVQEATITTEKDITLLMIPKEIYLKYWHDTYSVKEFLQTLPHFYTEKGDKVLTMTFDILEDIAMLDGELADEEVVFIQKFMESSGQALTAEEIRGKLLTGETTDFTILRQTAVRYLDLHPSLLQVGQLRDLVNLLVEADDDVSDEEKLMLSELNSLFEGYLRQDSNYIRYQVFVVPQSEVQDKAIQTLLVEYEKVESSYGHAYLCGTFHSRDYAHMIRRRYRDLNLYAVVEREEQ